jgi:murein DD-endopeptidase MepM/ murein hydrolase activator NlpD
MRRWLSLLLLAAALLAPRVDVAAQTSGPTYVIQEDDTLIGIAEKFGVSLEELTQANGISDPSLIFPGASLVIPGYEGVEGVLTARPIAYGETLASLAARSGVSQEVLIRINHLVAPGRLYVGQPVIAPVQEENPAALPTATLGRVGRGEPPLEIAIRNRVNPWVPLTQGSGSERLWAIPGSVYRIPGGETPVSGLAAPVAAVSVQPDTATQGGTEVVRVELTSPAWAEGSLGSWSLRFHPLGRAELVALQGVHALAEPGMYDLEIRILDSEGGSVVSDFSQPIRVLDGGYPFDPPLLVPPETIDPAVTGPEEERVLAVVTQTTEERLWDGPFQFPSPYTEAFPSRFGSRRNYNGLGYLSYHTGLDFYGGTGTAILAPAPGRVVFAGPLSVRGNATFIDHGWGVFTGYLHQSEIDVAVGDLVQTGQTIGLVGGTGRVTGPHLHWEIWVGGVPVNPLDWVANSYP